MGFFDAIGKARGAAGRGLMSFGGALRKAGDFGAPVIRKIGQVAGSRLLHAGIGLLGAGLAPVTGGASLAVAGAVNKGLSAVSNIAGKADGIAGAASALGQRLQNIGQTVGGFPQGATPYTPTGAAPAGMGGSMVPRRR